MENKLIASDLAHWWFAILSDEWEKQTGTRISTEEEARELLDLLGLYPMLNALDFLLNESAPEKVWMVYLKGGNTQG